MTSDARLPRGVFDMKRVMLWCLLALPLRAQGTESAPLDCAAVKAADHAGMDHTVHLRQLAQCEQQRRDAALPKQAGQAVFGAMAEVIQLLDADSTTDWAKVNLEALRQHLLDMDAVTMRSRVRQRAVPGGFTADVTGDGATVGAIRRMVVNHAKMLDASADVAATTTRIPGGVRLTVTQRDTTDARRVARLRGLGFAGTLTEGTHHVRHHLALARGDSHAHDH